MAFIVGNSKASGTSLTLPSFTTATRPSSPVTGQIIYNTTTQLMEIYANGQWLRADVFRGSVDYPYRQIITKGYVMGGYKSNSPWKNVNRMTHATDVCTNLGDLLAYAGAYTSGACNLTKGFLWSTDGTFSGSSTTTSAFNIATETTAGTNVNWNMKVSRDDSGTGFQEHLFAYITGGGTGAIDVFNMTTETMSAGWTQTSPSLYAGISYSTGDASAVSDENSCFFWSQTGSGTRLAFNTHTFTNSGVELGTYTIRGSSLGGAHGQQKGINSKLGRGYAGNEGTWNGGYNLRRMVFATDTYTTIAKPIGNSGEENFDMGQERQYMLGCYDGAQNNRTWKFVYATDTGSELGSGSTRTGVSGGSSGHCVWG